MLREGTALSSFPIEASFPSVVSISCVIVRDRHDKRLRFFHIFYRLSLAISVVVLFFFLVFSAQNGRFSISQKCDVAIRIFEIQKFQIILVSFLTVFNH